MPWIWALWYADLQKNSIARVREQGKKGETALFYIIDALGARATPIEALNPLDVNAGYLTKEQLEENYASLGISEAAVRECLAEKERFRNSFDVYDDFSFGMMNIVDVTDLHHRRDSVAFFVRKNLFVLVELHDEDGSTREMFERAIGRFKTNVTLEKVIYGIMERLLAGGYQELERAEQRMMEMELTLVRRDVHHKVGEQMNREIFNLKTRLTVQRSYYEQLMDIGETLWENENDLFDDANLRYLKMFAEKAARLSTATRAMCENLVHLREAYQAGMDYELNKIMKLFTVVTTVFLPLTLIVGWYGMNFTTMPELTWRYGYFGVIVLSLAVLVGCLVYFKKKKLM